MTSPTVPRWPLEDLSEIPDDWLAAFLVLVDEGGDRDPDTHFIDSMRAIFRMREIEGRGERDLHADHRNARLEKLRREGEPIPVERDQVYDWNGTAVEVTRMSAAAGWAEIRYPGASSSKRHRLPFPSDVRLIGWAR